MSVQRPPGKTITMDGVTFTLSPSTQGMQTAFSERLKERAKKEFDTDAADMRKRAMPLWSEARKLQEEIDNGAISADAIAKTQRFEEIVNEAKFLESEARESVDRFKRSKAAGDYEFYGEEGVRALGTTLGQIFMCWLMLKPKHPTLTLAEVERLHRGTLELNDEISRDDVLQHRNAKTMPGNKIGRVEAWQIAMLMADGIFEKKEPAASPPSGDSGAIEPPPSTSSTESTPAKTES